ncbi:hypothetical protein FOL47_003479 [Perkinsus chesapeaki]|uniref:Zinc finger CCCH-type TRM13 domain-containing protein n=1 Tax=Perkinsus chesapeaki TaxID=330153 RepID=A0A7J6M7Y1_PERCH|nr:hypothetical protein FOL47_003479 [Perkinsus chesapeaki]
MSDWKIFYLSGAGKKDPDGCACWVLRKQGYCPFPKEADSDFCGVHRPGAPCPRSGTRRWTTEATAIRQTMDRIGGHRRDRRQSWAGPASIQENTANVAADDTELPISMHTNREDEE